MQNNLEQEKWVILGGSRGLGAAFVRQVGQQCPGLAMLVSSRKQEKMQDFLQTFCEGGGNVQLLAADFVQKEGQQLVLEQLDQFEPHRVFYFAGGGPYGEFGQRAWRDHIWALEVNFLFAARVLHWALSKPEPQLKQFVLVGSAVAEDKPDPMAASYCAAKHALFGLYKSVVAENPKIDIRLFSPTYMDTELLPPNASPRQSGVEILNPDEVAAKMWEWVNKDDHQGHYRLEKLS